MKKLVLFGVFTALLFSFAVLIPDLSYAQEPTGTGLIPCDGPDCSQCDLITLGNNIINWLIRFLTIIAVIALVIAGFKLTTSGGDASAYQAAKETFTNIVIGFVLVLASWLIVDTILLAATGQSLSFWGQIECGSQTQGSASAGNAGTSASGATGGSVGNSTSAGGSVGGGLQPSTGAGAGGSAQ